MANYRISGSISQIASEQFEVLVITECVPPPSEHPPDRFSGICMNAEQAQGLLRELTEAMAYFVRHRGDVVIEGLGGNDAAIRTACG